MGNLDFLEQVMDSMIQGTEALEVAVKKNNKKDILALKSFLLDLSHTFEAQLEVDHV